MIKRICIIAIAITCLFLLFSQVFRMTSQPPSQSNSSFVYTNILHQFSITLPNNWEVFRENFHNAAVLFICPPKEKFDTWTDIGNVIIKPVNQNSSLDVLVENRIKENSQNSSFQLLEKGNSSNSSWIVYTTTGRTGPGKPLIKTQVYQQFSLQNGRFTTITCSALPETFDASRPTFESICNSLEWKK